MSDVIAFPAERSSARRGDFHEQPAQVVIFPGVRIERMAAAPRDDIPPRPRRARKPAPTKRPA